MNNHRDILYHKAFASFNNIVAFTTVRQTVKDLKPRFTGENISQVVTNRKELAELLGINPAQMVFPRQTHTSRIASIGGIPYNELTETDALMTTKPEICLCIQTADCVPILMFDPIKQAIAAVHAGWRGTVGQIAAVTIKRLIADASSDPSDIRVLIGPSIGPESYEVGDEVAELVKLNVPRAELTLNLNASGKYHLNLWEANRQILISSGLNPANIQITGECTYIKNDRYFSARHDGADTGRLVSGIMIR